MRRRLVICLTLAALTFSSGTPILAQDQNNPDVLRKELAETMSQLKAAQDRKNELANEYEKLKAQVATMQKQLDDATRTVAENAEQTYQIRSEMAAWNAFVDRDPRLRARWELFLEASIPELTLEDWMLGKPIPKSLFATTQPSTHPATAESSNPSTNPTTAPSSTTTSSGQ
ncbi:hypothetical protein BH09PLA1_BH09PLA1_34870 [soil metagenome]